MSSAMSSPYFHGIEHLTLDADGFLRWKDHCIERFTPEFAESNFAKGKAQVLAARCRHLEEIGKPVNKMSVVLKWEDKVKQEPVGAGRGR